MDLRQRKVAEQIVTAVVDWYRQSVSEHIKSRMAASGTALGRPRTLDAAKVKFALTLRREGVSYAKIAQVFGVKPNVIYYALLPPKKLKARRRQTREVVDRHRLKKEIVL